MEKVHKRLQDKIARYKASFGLSKSNRDSIRRECDKLQDKLNIEYIEPKDYVFLRSIAESVEGGGVPDLKALAIQAGYGSWQAERPENTILAHIPDSLYQEIVGISTKDIEDSLASLVRQDNDLSVKLRATELAAKIRGLNADNEAINITLGNFIQK